MMQNIRFKTLIQMSLDGKINLLVSILKKGHFMVKFKIYIITFSIIQTTSLLNIL